VFARQIFEISSKFFHHFAHDFLGSAITGGFGGAFPAKLEKI
jgi:hypothetical protein